VTAKLRANGENAVIRKIKQAIDQCIGLIISCVAVIGCCCSCQLWI
jgi:hypothetical protein